MSLSHLPFLEPCPGEELCCSARQHKQLRQSMVEAVREGAGREKAKTEQGTLGEASEAVKREEINDR